MSIHLSAQKMSYHANLNQSNSTEAMWVDSVFNSLSEDQRIGQLFMIRAHSNLGADHVRSVESMIKNYHVGGLCFFQGTPEEQVRLIHRYQKQASLPMMIAIDGEWGLGMRMKKSTISYPHQLTLGAIRDNQLIYKMGTEIARQMKRVGVHINFAPVVDVNNNVDNPVIGTRSFGEDKINVALKGINYMKGMQDNGVLACAKHFPGHGDTNTDSHYALPLIQHNKNRLDSLELYPFKQLIDNGVASIMSAHLQIPVYDDRPNRPTSLSQTVVKDLLQDSLQFNGLVFTDGLGMKGVSAHFAEGAIEAEALLAGNDVLLLPQSLDKARKQIKHYISEGTLSWAAINKKVKRILRAKYRLGFEHFQLPDLNNVRADLNSAQAKVLEEELVEHSLTLVRDPEQLLPIGSVDYNKIAALALGTGRQPFFQKRLRDYGPISLRQASYQLSEQDKANIKEALKHKELLIVSLHNLNKSSAKNFGVKTSIIHFLEELDESHKLILVVFGTPYCLGNFDNIATVLAAYTEEQLYQDLSAQAVFGAVGINGRLPVSASKKSSFNTGVSRGVSLRMGYSHPERVGINSDSLALKIGHIAKEAISKRATPGCVVLVARKGKIVFNEAYGYHTYAKKVKTKKDDIFDLASITKVAATTLSLMDLVQKSQLGVDDKLGEHLPSLKGGNKDTLSVRDILSHHAKLKPWIPFYTSTLTDNGNRKKNVYRSQQSGLFNVAISSNLYMNQMYIDSVWASINESDLRQNNDYRYSDLGFYYFSDLVKKLSGQDLDAYTQEQFYRPLGLYNIGFNPSHRFTKQRIPPTEEDAYWRKQKVQGYVHDMGAAMLGGVSGHAGLFANSHDLAVLSQMLLQKGIYGNRVYLKADVIDEFSSRYKEETRRGLGFDMKQLDESRSENMSEHASEYTFGHLGFTGTCVWIDPVEDLVFIFLSNRTYPSMRNNKLARMDIRPRIQSAVYESMVKRGKVKTLDLLKAPALPKSVESIN